ncbi:hypothetical protein M5D96_013893 [Drosophila gunungcola]|uniref:Uncharacterized protein n=1 Tax=Drosophila gunungcola TaxID=103775 RepID=A0A9Q0BIF7_9MUSC|nr:hypothetical protein M5D96_013893 [Drosophila gunungcola]
MATMANSANTYFRASFTQPNMSPRNRNGQSSPLARHSAIRALSAMSRNRLQAIRRLLILAGLASPGRGSPWKPSHWKSRRWNCRIRPRRPLIVDCLAAHPSGPSYPWL